MTRAVPITASGPTDTPGASVAGAVVRADDHYGAPPRGAVVGALLVVQVLFGLSYVCTKWVVDEVPPGAWAAVRACAATIVLVGTAVAWRLPFPRAGRDLAALAAVAMLGVATNQLCFVAGLALSTPGFSSVINVAIPVATLVIAWALRWERLDRRRALGVALAGGGLAILLWGTVRADWREGNWLTFANAIAFSLFLVLSRPLYRRMHPYSATAVMFVFGSVVLVAWGGGEAMAVPWGGLSTKAWIGMIYVVLGATVGTYGLNAYALRHADASLVGFFVIVQPLLATAISAIEGREALDARFVMAAVLVGTGVLTVVGLPRRAVVHTQNAERGTQNASPASVGVEP